MGGKRSLLTSSFQPAIVKTSEGRSPAHTSGVQGINEQSETNNSATSLTFAVDNDVVLDAETCPILRDSGLQYKPLERLFGTLVAGQAFGESSVLSAADGKFQTRFYNAVALTEVYYLQITKEDFLRVYGEQQRRSLLEKQAFLKTIPEFDNPSLTRSKL